MTTTVTHSARQTIRAGFLGGGFMARVHAHAARVAQAELTALASTSARRAAQAAVALGVDRALTADELLASPDVQVVHVCTPNATHAPLVAAALRAGKHVICEKPLATNLRDAMALERLAEKSGLVGAVPFVYRYHSMVREARARVLAGELGELVTLDCAYLQDWMLLPTDDDWRAGDAEGGPSRAFADIGSHLCDLIEFVSGESITRLNARTRRVFEQRGGREVSNEDAVAVIVEMTSGAIGTLLISQMAAGRKNALTFELHGTSASVRFDQERPEELWVGRREANTLMFRDPDGAAASAARFSRIPAGHAQGYQDAFNTFVADVYEAIGGGQPDGLPSFADGVRAVRLTEAVLESNEQQLWVDVTPHRQQSLGRGDARLPADGGGRVVVDLDRSSMSPGSAAAGQSFSAESSAEEAP